MNGQTGCFITEMQKIKQFYLPSEIDNGVIHLIIP